MSEHAWMKSLAARTEGHRERIFAAEEFLWKHPATGYREWKASEYLASRFQELGYAPRLAGDIPGFYADLDTGRPGPRIALLGELDSVLCASHPDADPDTGAVHACGHHAQCAALLGAAATLREPEFADMLCGSVRFMAVPAEELLELSYREELRRQGVIRYYGGKVEFLRRGYFEDVGMALLLHVGGPAGTLKIRAGNNGCILKNVRYTGRAAHAGGAPHEGINALYAANLGLAAINALRETFREKDHIRVHPILTQAGRAVNVIPDTVTLESYVRGATLEAFARENSRVNRALAGAAAALGARIAICDRPGYMPLKNDPELGAAVRSVAEALCEPGKVIMSSEWDTGCTDMGDLSCVMPVVQPSIGGAEGQGHGDNYRIADRESACVLAAKILAASAVALLSDSGARAQQVLARRNTPFATTEDYFRAIDALALDCEAVRYNNDGTATLAWRSPGLHSDEKKEGSC
ncbi:MAG: amidohydrolase [Christensenellales bacterium]|jgi:amidohydrolase